MQQVTINRFDPTIGFVPIPKGAKCNITFYNDDSIWVLHVTDLNGNCYYVDMPSGKWEILFRDSERRVIYMYDLYIKEEAQANNIYTLSGWCEFLFCAHSIQLTEHQDLLILKKVEK